MLFFLDDHPVFAIQQPLPLRGLHLEFQFFDRSIAHRDGELTIGPLGKIVERLFFIPGVIGV